MRVGFKSFLSKPLRLLVLALVVPGCRDAGHIEKILQPKQEASLNQGQQAIFYFGQLPIVIANNYHEKTLNNISKLAESNKFFQLALDSINEKSYEFFTYDKNDEAIPPKVHETMAGGEYYALTWKNLKKIFIDVERIKLHAKEQNENPDHALLGTLSNELVHIILDPTKKGEEEGVYGDPLNEDESREEFDEMFKSKEYTESEQVFHLVINEEVLSQVVEDIIVKQQVEPGFKLSAKDIQVGKDSARLTQLTIIKFELSIPVFGRFFDLSVLKEDEVPAIISRINRYLRSGEIENYLAAKLQEFDLLREGE